jgi:trans-2,3-dihydro-3-hydroxyanthranilate isomerase
MQLPFFTVDVFTTRRFAGNPLAIVEDADDLSTAQMQTIAREYNLSETIFVRRPADPAHTASVRIFFPTDEIPFAGHPTIGCAIHLARKLHGSGDFETVITLEEVAGLVPVKVTAKGGSIEAQLTAPVVPFAGAGKAPGAAMAAAALGLSADHIGMPGHAIGQWQGGPTFLFVPVANTASLSSARPCEPAWSAMMDFADVHNAYLYTRDPADPRNTLRSRMFAPTAGTPEDPATGSASALLAAQLLASGELAEGTNAFALRQGYDMGRPSDIGMEADVSSGRLAAVRISGSSVPVSQGLINAI